MILISTEGYIPLKGIVSEIGERNVRPGAGSGHAPETACRSTGFHGRTHWRPESKSQQLGMRVQMGVKLISKPVFMAENTGRWRKR